jgi:hypothetical protein
LYIRQRRDSPLLDPPFYTNHGTTLIQPITSSNKVHRLILRRYYNSQPMSPLHLCRKLKLLLMQSPINENSKISSPVPPPPNVSRLTISNLNPGKLPIRFSRQDLTNLVLPSEHIDYIKTAAGGHYASLFSTEAERHIESVREKLMVGPIECKSTAFLRVCTVLVMTYMHTSPGEAIEGLAAFLKAMVVEERIIRCASVWEDTWNDLENKADMI